MSTEKRLGDLEEEVKQLRQEVERLRDLVERSGGSGQAFDARRIAKEILKGNRAAAREWQGIKKGKP